MKNKLTCYIIDDEPLAQEILEEYIGKLPFLELKGTFSSALEAAAPLKTEQPDLIFLDINMPELDGLSFIPMLNPRPMIILTTAYDHYALKAFELEVKDYLLKPFSFERFYKAAMLVYQQYSGDASIANQVSAEPTFEPNFIFLKIGHRIQRIAIQDILFIEGMKDYLRVHTRQEKFMTLTSFAKLEELLPSTNFVRVHRSFMIAIDKIDHIEKNRISINSEIIPISESYAEAFYSRLKGL